METIQIEIALVDGSGRVDAGWQMPYSQRPIVGLMVDTDATLESVFAQARSKFEIQFPGVNLHDAGFTLDFFHGDESEPVVPRYMQARGVTIVGPDGFAWWNVSPKEARISEMLAAKKLGIFVGDPLKPYLLSDPGGRMAGPGDAVSWDTIVSAVDLLEKLEFLVGYFTGQTNIGEMANRVRGWAVVWRNSVKVGRLVSQLEERGASFWDFEESVRQNEEFQLNQFMNWSGVRDPQEAAALVGLVGYEVAVGSGSCLRNIESTAAQEVVRRVAEEVYFDPNLTKGQIIEIIEEIALKER